MSHLKMTNNSVTANDIVGAINVDYCRWRHDEVLYDPYSLEISDPGNPLKGVTRHFAEWHATRMRAICSGNHVFRAQVDNDAFVVSVPYSHGSNLGGLLLVVLLVDAEGVYPD